MRGLRWLATSVLGLILVGCSASAPGPEDDESRLRDVTYVLLPHPDDEFQVWSQIEGRADSYTVFILMTRGEQTAYCDSDAGGGRWTTACTDARLASWIGFFEQMSADDDALPGAFPQEPDLVSGLALNGVDVGRDDDGEVTVDTDAFVWHDADERGALIAFDLGDGDLTGEEVAWAARHVIDDPARFGLPDRGPDRLLGSYYYVGEQPECFQYAHPDHAAVAEAIQTTELAPMQAYASCSAAGTGTVVESPVSDSASAAAFGDGGAFPGNYGWLGEWPLAQQDQSELFHVPQAFVVVSES